MIVALAVLAGAWLAARNFAESGRDPEIAWALLWYAVIGGFLGAKLYYALLHGPQSLLSRAGLVWYGGFIGGSAAVLWAIRRKKLPVASTADLLAPALALGHGIGRIACFFSGDSYGVPSSLPWAVAFPRGAPPSSAGNLRAFGVEVSSAIPDDTLLRVHPTMLYSAVALLALAGFLWWYRRRRPAAGRIFALYLLLAGAERFLVEFLRAKDDRLLWGMTTAQGIAFLAVTAGVIMLLRLRDKGSGSEGRQVQTPVPAARAG